MTRARGKNAEQQQQQQQQLDDAMIIPPPPQTKKGEEKAAAQAMLEEFAKRMFVDAMKTDTANKKAAAQAGRPHPQRVRSLDGT